MLDSEETVTDVTRDNGRGVDSVMEEIGLELEAGKGKEEDESVDTEDITDDGKGMSSGRNNDGSGWRTWSSGLIGVSGR
jgi:hypothetical protein